MPSPKASRLKRPSSACAPGSSCPAARRKRLSAGMPWREWAWSTRCLRPLRPGLLPVPAQRDREDVGRRRGKRGLARRHRCRRPDDAARRGRCRGLVPDRRPHCGMRRSFFKWCGDRCDLPRPLPETIRMNRLIDLARHLPTPEAGLTVAYTPIRLTLPEPARTGTAADRASHGP